MQDRDSFTRRIEATADRIFDYIYNNKIDVINIPHLADADGFCSEIILKKTFSFLKDKLHYENINEIIVDPKMRLSSNPEDEENNIERIINEYQDISENKLLLMFSDIGGSCAEAIEKTKSNSNLAAILDHHMGKDIFSNETQTYTCNPNHFGIDGQDDASGSIISYLVCKRILEKAAHQYIEDFKPDVPEDYNDIIKQTRRELKRTLLEIELEAVVGASADQQKREGIFRELIDDLVEKKALTKVPTAFYGYRTKSLFKVLSESSIPFNIKYCQKTETPPGFHFTDDFEKGEQKNQIAKQYLNSTFMNYVAERGYHLNDIVNSNEKRKEINTGETTFAELTQSDLTETGLKLFKEEFRRNITMFADPARIDEFLRLTEQSTYIINLPGDEKLDGDSINENAHKKTAISKIGYRDEYENMTKEEMNLILRAYHRGIWRCMREFENIILGESNSEKSRFYRLDQKYEGNRIYVAEIHDELAPLFMEEIRKMKIREDKFSFDKVNGVLAGMVEKNRMLPGNYGLFLTVARVGNKYKISGRLSDHPKYQHIHLGEIFGQFGGGGHRTAAAYTTDEEGYKRSLKYLSELEVK